MEAALIGSARPLRLHLASSLLAHLPCNPLEVIVERTSCFTLACLERGATAASQEQTCLQLRRQAPLAPERQRKDAQTPSLGEKHASGPRRRRASPWIYSQGLFSRRMECLQLSLQSQEATSKKGVQTHLIVHAIV